MVACTFPVEPLVQCTGRATRCVGVIARLYNITKSATTIITASSSFTCKDQRPDCIVFVFKNTVGTLHYT